MASGSLYLNYLILIDAKRTNASQCANDLSCFLGKRSEIICNVGVMHAEKKTKLHQILLLSLSQCLFYKIRKYELSLLSCTHIYKFSYRLCFFFLFIVVIYLLCNLDDIKMTTRVERMTCNNLQNQHQKMYMTLNYLSVHFSSVAFNL